MHYSDGTEVKLGDVCRVVANPANASYQQQEVVGLVYGGTPSSTSCNIVLNVVLARSVGPMGTSQWTPVTFPQWSATAGECVLVSR